MLLFCSTLVKRSYQIDVTTGGESAAGTDASVTFTLFSRGTAEGPFVISGSGSNFDQSTTGTYYRTSILYPIDKIR